MSESGLDKVKEEKVKSIQEWLVYMARNSKHPMSDKMRLSWDTKPYEIKLKKRNFFFRWLREKLGINALAYEFYRHDHKGGRYE